MRKFLLLIFIVSSLAANAQNDKSFKLELYNSDEYKNYASINADDKSLLETASFVCELVNVFDPDSKFEIVKFEFTIKTKDAEQKYTSMSEAGLLEKIKQTESVPDGSIAAKITITKVFYIDNENAEKSMGIDNYGYAEILVY